MHFLHAFDIEIERIGEWIGDFSGLEGVFEFADGVLDGETGGIAEFAKDFIRRNVVGAIIVSGGMGDFDLAADHFADFLGDGVEREVLVTGIEDLTIDLGSGQGEAFYIKFGTVSDMEIGPKLTAAEDSYFAFVDSVVSEDVDREVEAQAGRPSANGGWAKGERGETGSAAFFQFVLAHGFEAGVVGKRLARQILGNILFLLDPIHTGGGGVDETLNATVLGDIHKRHEGIVIDRAAQTGIELEAGVVGNAGEVNNSIATGQ